MSGESASQLTRASLLERLATAQAAEREWAWSEFQSRYTPVITAFARRCGAAPHEIDDVVQDVLTSFLSASGKFAYDPGRGRFRGYLKTCTVRAALRRIHKTQQFRGLSLNQLAEAEQIVEPVWDDCWEQQLMAHALRIARDEAGTGPTFRAFEQYVLLDRPAETVAVELGLSVNSVHQAKSRITKQLREIVQRLRAEE